MYSPSIQKLIELFSKFPTVGPKTAARFVFYLIKMPEEKFKELTDSLQDIKKTTKLCSFCFNPFDSSNGENLCPICRNNAKDKNLLCVVEKEADLNSIESTKKYKGLYFVLGGTLSLKKERNIRIEELKERIKNSDFKEIIIATNPTTEGETTALYLERELKIFNIKLTRLGKGLPMGGELEYADDQTLENALETRK